MKKEITRDELYNIFGACSTTAKEMVDNRQKGNGAFLNFLFNNRDRALPLLREIEKERPVAGDKLREFSKKEQVILKAMAIKVESDSPEDAEARKKTYEQEAADLKLEYKEEIDAWETSVKEFEAKLDNKLTFDVVMLDEKNLPSEVSADAMEIFYKLVITK